MYVLLFTTTLKNPYFLWGIHHSKIEENLYYFLEKTGFIFCFSSSEMHQSDHLAGCYAKGINSFLTCFLNVSDCLCIF